MKRQLFFLISLFFVGLSSFGSIMEGDNNFDLSPNSKEPNPDWSTNLGTKMEIRSIDFTSSSDYKDAVLIYPTEGSGPFPVITFMHGVKSGGKYTYGNYGKVLTYLASHGYIVLAPRVCQDDLCLGLDEDLLISLSYAKKQYDLGDTAFSYASFDKVGLLGYSMGGASAVHAACEIKQFKLGATVAIHPLPWWNVCANGPALFLTASKDFVIPSFFVRTSYFMSGFSPKVYANMKGGDHVEIQNHKQGKWNSYILAFLDCYLKDNQEQCQVIYGEASDSLCHNPDIPMKKCMFHD